MDPTKTFRSNVSNFRAFDIDLIDEKSFLNSLWPLLLGGWFLIRPLLVVLNDVRAVVLVVLRDPLDLDLGLQSVGVLE